MLSATPAQTERFHFIDGLRGLFSLIVLLFHVFFIFYDQWMPPFSEFGILFDGTIAVHVFFVLSGFSLTIGYFTKLEAGDEKADNIVRRMAVARYPRLALPSLAACLLMYVVINSGLNYYSRIPTDFKPEWWGWAYGKNVVGLGETVKFALYSVFMPSAFIPVTHYEGPYLITNLWTMSIEFVGSMLVFLYALSVRNNRGRILISAGITLCLAAAGSYFSHFFAGVVLADVFLKSRKLTIPGWAELLNAALIATLFSVRPDTFYSDVFYCLLIVFAISLGQYSRAFFGSVALRYLGSISFALYLVHMPLIVSVQSYLFLAYKDQYSHTIVIALSALITIVASLITAHFFAHIDRYATKSSQKFGSFVVGA